MAAIRVKDMVKLYNEISGSGSVKGRDDLLVRQSSFLRANSSSNIMGWMPKAVDSDILLCESSEEVNSMDKCLLHEKVVELGGPDLFLMGDNPSHWKQLPSKEEKDSMLSSAKPLSPKRPKFRYIPGSVVLRRSNPKRAEELLGERIYKKVVNPFEALATDATSSYPLEPNNEKKASPPPTVMVVETNSKLPSEQEDEPPFPKRTKYRYIPGSVVLRRSNPKRAEELLGERIYKKVVNPFEALTTSVSKLVLPTDVTSSYPLEPDNEKKAPPPTLMTVETNSKLPSE